MPSSPEIDRASQTVSGQRPAVDPGSAPAPTRCLTQSATGVRVRLMKFRRPRKLRPLERVPDAIALALLLLGLAVAGYELGLGFAILGGGLIAATQGTLQHQKSKRRSARHS